MKTIELELNADNVPEDELSDATQTLKAVLGETLPDVPIGAPIQTRGVGGKGDPITISTIVITAFTSGAVAALIGAFKAVFARNRKIVVKVKRPNGDVVEVNAENIDRATVRHALEQL